VLCDGSQRPVVEFNGGFISDLATGQHLVTNAMDSMAVTRAYELIRAATCHPFVSSFDGASDRLHYKGATNPGMQWYIDDRCASRDHRLNRTEDLSARLCEQVVCLTVIERPAVVDEFFETLATEFAGVLSVRRFGNEYFSGWD